MSDSEIDRIAQTTEVQYFVIFIAFKDSVVQYRHKNFGKTHNLCHVTKNVLPMCILKSTFPLLNCLWIILLYYTLSYCFSIIIDNSSIILK